MHFVEAIAVVISGIFALAMVDALSCIAPRFQSTINVVFIGRNTCSRFNRRFNERPNGDVLDVFYHPNDDLPTAFNHTKDRGLFFGQRAATSSPFEATTFATLLAHLIGIACVPGNDGDLVACDLARQADGFFGD